jgi:8-oxo-dGTP diphosphatase
MRHSSDNVGIDNLALAILRRDGGIVLVQQGHGAAAPYWVLPGGLVEAGELIVDALIREVREEAGAQVTAIGRLACLSQIDRPEHALQTMSFVFEVVEWQGDLRSDDPDNEILSVELVPLAEAIERLASNGGWPGIQEPLLAYLRGEAAPGTLHFYRETGGRQQLVMRLAE